MTKKRCARVISRNSGITMVVLIIMIVVLLVLASVTISEVQGHGLITNAIKSRLYQEMSELEEEKEFSIVTTILKEEGSRQEETNDFLANNLTTEELQNLSETLKAEIIYVRNSFGEKERLTSKQIWENNMFECQDMYTNNDYLSGLSEDIYYISQKSSGKEKTYLYDSVSNICFKIPQTRIGKYVVHSLPYAKFIIDGADAIGIGVVDFDAEVKIATDGTKYYEPDLNNFSF